MIVACIFHRIKVLGVGARWYTISIMFFERKGFTIVELLVIIAIMGLLAAIIMANVLPARQSARIARAQSDIRAIILAVSLLESHTGQWPGHSTPWVVQSGASGNEVWDLNSQEAGITQNDAGTPYVGWKGPYISVVPLDPWGNPYFFDTDYDVNFPNGVWSAVVGSFGPNGAGQNEYDADDIYLEIVRE